MIISAVGGTKVAVQQSGRQQQRAEEELRYDESSSSSLVASPKPVELIIDRWIEELMYLESAHQRLRRSQYNPSFPPPMSLEWSLIGHSRMAIDFGEMPIAYPPFHPIKFVPMEERLRHRIHYRMTSDDFELPPTFKAWITADLVYTIEWLKTLSFFQQLRECEKFRLARNITQAVAYLTAAFDSIENRNSDVTVMPDGTMLCQGKTLRESSVEHDKWFGVITRLKEIRVDKKEYVLIKAIIACDSDDEVFCPESRDLLRKQQQLFAKSLLSYVLASRGTAKGPYAYTQMLSLIGWQKAAISKLKHTYFLLSALKIITSFHGRFLDDVNAF